jgi:hypothetical protein
MKFYLTLAVFIYYSFVSAQPTPPPCILMKIIDNPILRIVKNNRQDDRYYINYENFKNEMEKQKEITENEYYYYYFNNKNYYTLNDPISTLFSYCSICLSFGKNGIDANSIIRISFLDKETKQEMNIYLRDPVGSERGSTVLKGISFKEGDFFFDLYSIEPLGIMPDIDYTTNTLLITLKDMERHRIQKSQMKQIIKPRE